MLSAPDKALLVKLFYMNEESATIALRKFRVQKNVKSGPCIAVEMEAIVSEAVSGTSSAREAARRLGLPPSSVRNILRRILELYPYKLQSCHELLPADTAQGKHLRSGPSLKWNRIPPGVLTSCGQMKLISRFMVTLTTITVAFG
ncbi:hypothetical protein TNCV_3345661 [Trichonephila clavipes]|nr:hypothetical protein TNCV_3345661 [Trichonephila clavipes]